MDKHFFDTVRPLFRKLSQEQVDALERIVDYGARRGVSREHLAYILATIFHETARWMVPIREGARRFGRNYTDAQARRAVTAIYNKGIIRTNYALPHANGHAYYGRGLVQITWGDNYRQFGIYGDPDRALDWDKALEIAFDGMRDGVFTGKSLADVAEDGVQNYTNDRIVVNGDVKKNGPLIARHANTFFAALENYKPKEAPDVRSSDPDSPWRPNWWPFDPSR